MNDDKLDDVPREYQLIGPSDDGRLSDVLYNLKPKEGRQRLQALIAEWLRMENVVVLTGAGCSRFAGGKLMSDLEVSVLGSVKQIKDFPEGLRKIIDDRLYKTKEAQASRPGLEDWLSFLVNAVFLTSAGHSPFAGLEWKVTPGPSTKDLEWLVRTIGKAIFAECALSMPDRHPWVLVLEEAHNYARPPRSDEDRGQTQSRLEGTNRELLNLFIYEQWRRVPDMHEQVFTGDRMRSHALAAIADIERTNGPIDQNKKEELLNEMGDARARRQIAGRALRKSSGAILGIFQQKALVFVEAPVGSEFIIGSHTVIKSSEKSSDLRHSSVEIWLPFTPRFATVLLGNRKLSARVLTNHDQVAGINQALARKSSIVASKNVELLRLLRPGSQILQS